MLFACIADPGYSQEAALKAVLSTEQGEVSQLEAALDTERELQTLLQELSQLQVHRL